MDEVQTFWQSLSALLPTIGFSLLIWLGFFLLSLLLGRWLLPKLQKQFEDKKRHPLATSLVYGFTRPSVLFFRLVGFFCALMFFCQALPEEASVWLAKTAAWLLPGLSHAIRITAVVCVAWGLIGASSATSYLMKKVSNKLEVQANKTFTRFLSAIFNVLVVSFAVVIIITELGYNVSALITGLGLGGLTIALAAKDSAANFFGGLIMVTEKPFEIGDWISFDGVEGTVEDINLRSTKIRTGPGSLTIVPNATLAAANITNWSGGMEKRQANFKLALRYDTPEDKLREFLAATRNMLETDPEIQTDSVMVRFSGLSESSLDVLVRFYTTLPGYADHMRILERVNFSLIALAKEKDVEFAYPTRTLYVQKQDTSTESPSLRK